MTEHGPVLQITRDGETKIVDLGGDSVRTLTGDTGAALALSWGEDPPPAEVTEAAEGDGDASP